MNVKILRAEWRVVCRASLKLMHNSLSMVGLLAVGAAAIAFAQPDYAHAVGRWIVPVSASPPVAAVRPEATVEATAPIAGTIVHPGGEAGRLLGLVASDAATPEEPVVLEQASKGERPALQKEKRDVARYLARKYRVNGDAVGLVVDAAYVTGKDLGLDPLLLLSVMGVESGFNPFAESTAGATGLMQLMAKVHRDKLDDFGGRNIALNPVVSLRVGAVVLKDCIRRGGSVADGLRLYVGAGMGDDNGYGARVLSEKDRLLQAARGVTPSPPRPRIVPIPAAPDAVTPPSGAEGKADAARHDVPSAAEAERLAVL